MHFVPLNQAGAATQNDGLFLPSCHEPTQRFGKFNRTHKLIAALIVCIAVATAFQASASFSLGDAANFAVLFEGVGNNQLQFNNGAINGNIGLGPPTGYTGNPKFAQSSGDVIGDLYFAGVKNSAYPGSGTFTGSVIEHSSLVTSALATVN